MFLAHWCDWKHNYYAITVWYGGATVEDKSKLEKLVETASKVIGTDLPSVECIYNDRLANRTFLIMDEVTHPSHKFFNFLPSNLRLLAFKGTKRFLSSFYPAAVSHFNRNFIHKV